MPIALIHAILVSLASAVWLACGTTHDYRCMSPTQVDFSQAPGDRGIEICNDGIDEHALIPPPSSGAPTVAPPIRLPDQVDLGSADFAVRDQSNTPRCSSFGLIGAMELWLKRSTDPNLRIVDLSETHLFWLQRMSSSASAAVAAASKHLVMQEPFWPQSRHTSLDRVVGKVRLWSFWGRPEQVWKDSTGVYLSKVRYIGAESSNTKLQKLSSDDIEMALQELASGNPLYFGSSSNASLFNLDSPVDSTKPPGGVGHAYAVIGYRLTSREPLDGYFLVRNSYGTIKQQSLRSSPLPPAGYQWLPFDYCWAFERSYCYVWSVQEVKSAIFETNTPLQYASH